VARQRDYGAEYAARNLRAKEDYGLTGYSQLRALGGRRGLAEEFPLSDRARSLIPANRQAEAHREYIKARIALARRAADQGKASSKQRRIADSFDRRQTRQQLSEYGQPLPPPPLHRPVRQMYDWYAEWESSDDPWIDLEDYDTP
jgi:hypothetical protein